MDLQAELAHGLDVEQERAPEADGAGSSGSVIAVLGAVSCATAEPDVSDGAASEAVALASSRSEFLGA